MFRFFFFFLEDVTVNPNITKQKGKAFIGSDDHVQILSMTFFSAFTNAVITGPRFKIWSISN